jgi:4-amino-4-deoxy-L-arabinose transferase-like glycosyltransferase
MRIGKLSLVLIAAVYLVVGGLYAIYTPAWQAPDEPAHYNYVRFLAEHGRLPELRPGDYPAAYLEQIKSTRFPPDMPIDSIRYESWQPPLYYILAAPIYRLTGGALIPLRLLSVVLGAGLVVTAYALALTVRPGDTPLALGTAAFVAFVPMHLTMTASVNNDTPAELLLALVMLRLMRWVRGAAGQGKSTPRPYSLVITGLLLGLGLVTKATVYAVAIPLTLVALWLYERRPALLARRTLAVFGPALLLATPWYVRNVTLYGWPDLLGKRNHDAIVVGQLRTADYLGQVGWAAYLGDFATTSFHSFWGQFGWMAVPMDGRVYLALGLFSAMAVVGLALGARGCPPRLPGPPRPVGQPVLASGPGDRLAQPRTGRRAGRGGLGTGGKEQGERNGFILAGLWVIFTGLFIYIYYNLSFVQFQGRYLFPALAPIGLFATLGLREILSRRQAWVGASLCCILAMGIGLNSALNSGLDKGGLLIAGGVAVALAARHWLPARFDGWVLAAPSAGLAALSVYSLFAFIVPYL